MVFNKYVLLIVVLALLLIPLVFSNESEALIVNGGSNKVRVVIGYRDESSRRNLLRNLGVSPVKEIRDLKILVVEIPESLITRVKSLPGIRYIEKDIEARAFGISNYYGDIKWNMYMIGITDVWDYYYQYYGRYTFGRGVVVAVLDTGIDYTHPDLYGRVAYCIRTTGSTTYRGTSLSNCMDGNGHGTHVAGIIAATINGAGVAGVAPNVTLIAVKVLYDSGSGSVTDIAEGIVEAVKAGAYILSMSLGSSSDNSVLRDASNWAYQQGAIQIVAAGNSGDGNPSTDNVNYPARYPWVIAVAAVDSKGNTPSWSSDGPEVDVAAPGVNILSTYPNKKYAYLSGTSMATPHVTGVVAVIEAMRYAAGKSWLGFDAIYKVLTSTAYDLGSSGFDVYTGYGLVDAYSAVQYALSLP
nr:subtilisin-like serine protease [uncultured bacterium]